MKKLLLLAILVLSVTYSCTPDDSDSGAIDGPITANIRFEVVATRSSEAIITTTIDDETETEEVESLPFNKTFSQTEVELGTFLQLTYLENGTYNVTPDGSSWTDYTVILTIYINNTAASIGTFVITEGDSEVKQIDFTIN
ncbi:MAG: hypothetical protein V7719_08615 [Psychroserpens sp.]|uniref:hypothetical protein n=1 Tax=Psychroserpens sp. TaxID=2020870 RepID=UPI003003A14D